MSPHNVSNLVTDLVEMAQATQRLPQVEADNERLQKALDRALEAVTNRESNIIGYKQEIEELHAKVRSLEVERDDASFRVLEAEEQIYRATVLARAMQTTLGSMINELDPPKPEPMKEPEPIALTNDQRVPDPQAQPVATPAEGQSVSDPTNSPIGSSQDTLGDNNVSKSATPTDWEQDKAETSLIKPVPEAVSSVSDLSQSESSPTVKEEGTSSETASLPSVSSTDVDTTAGKPSPGSYFNKRYIDAPMYISYYDWIEGGGTHDDYYAGRS